jgi:methionyl-tRNA formyltransferase
VVFIAPEEPLVLPSFFERVLPVLGDQAAAVVVVSPTYENSGRVRQALEFLRSFGPRWSAIQLARYSWSMALDTVDRVVHLKHPRSVRAVCNRYGTRSLRPRDVNDPGFIALLRTIDPDLVISVSCPQIFRRQLLELPRLGCLNVHSAMLPKYRGVLPTFWALANDDPETGVTVHRMTDRIDKGDVIAQRRVSITPNETLLSLMRKTKRVGADLVLESVEAFDSGSVSPMVPGPTDQDSYVSFPARADVDRFRSLGRKI